jgi:Fe-Mn family superoxide dismutase
MNKLEKKIQQVEKQIIETHITKEKQLLITEMKKIGIEELPYSYSALRQFIDPETMNIHYNKHYKGYVDKLNNALSKKKYGDLELEQIIKTISRFDKTIRNNAGGAFNHALFWNMLTPKPKKLQGELYKKIIKQFGTFTEFKKKFETIAKESFGSGWVWLVVTKNNSLKIMTTPNQDNPLMNVIEGGGFPILGLDLWEHAYYLKYQNKRDEYISNFWKVVNWDFVSKLYSMKLETQLLEQRFGKIIMTEQTNEGKKINYIEACSSEETAFFGTIMTHPKIGLKYKSGMKNILKKIPWLTYDKGDNNRMDGFYFDGERHPLSWLAGNFRAFCLIAKSVNKLLNLMGKKTLNFSNLDEEVLSNEVTELLEIVEKYRNKIFATDSVFYKAIEKNLKQSKEKGDKVEDVTFKRLVKKFGESNVKVVSSPGSVSDFEGNDALVRLNGQTKSIQIKPLWKVEENPDGYNVYTTGKIENYKQDWMVFSSNHSTLIFDNQGMEARENYYFFPEPPIYNLK